MELGSWIASQPTPAQPMEAVARGHVQSWTGGRCTDDGCSPASAVVDDVDAVETMVGHAQNGEAGTERDDTDTDGKECFCFVCF